MTRTKRLTKWANTLSQEQMVKTLVDCVGMLVDAEDVSFWDDTVVPYWSNSGDNLDGSESAEE